MAVHDPLRVLILDDEHVIADTLAMVLIQSGYQARAVYSHETALAIADEFEPDVLITGYNNCCIEYGCETAAQILTFLPACRILVFSGSRNAADGIEYYTRYGYHFEVLAKPVHPQDLLGKLGSYATEPAFDHSGIVPPPPFPPPLPVEFQLLQTPSLLRRLLSRLGFMRH
jgi:CheY-like chemotaxis protein